MYPFIVDCRGSAEDIQEIKRLSADYRGSLRAVTLYSAENFSAFPEGLRYSCGIGRTVLSPSSPRQTEKLSSPAELIAESLSAGRRLSIFALGPLTELAVFMLSYPHLLNRIEKLIIMGGALYSGNASPAAEENFFTDPEAAAIVFNQSVPIVLIPLEQQRGRPWDMLRICLEQPRALITESLTAEIELESPVSRGSSVIDILARDKSLQRRDVVTGLREGFQLPPALSGGVSWP